MSLVESRVLGGMTVEGSGHSSPAVLKILVVRQPGSGGMASLVI
jgi:hypothetical protein